MFFGESRPVLPYFQHGVARRFLPWPPVAPRSATTLFALHACAISRIPSAKSLWDWSAGRPPTDLSISHGAAAVMRKSQIGFASRLLFSEERPFPPGFFMRALSSPRPLPLFSFSSVDAAKREVSSSVLCTWLPTQIHARRWRLLLHNLSGIFGAATDLWWFRLRLSLRAFCEKSMATIMLGSSRFWSRVSAALS